MSDYSKRVAVLLETPNKTMPNELIEYILHREELAAKARETNEGNGINWFVLNCCDYVMLREGLAPDRKHPHTPDKPAYRFFNKSPSP